MNWGTIRDACRVKLQDANGAFWTNEELLGDAIEVYGELTLDCEATTKTHDFPLVSGQRTYSLPEDCYELRNVRVNGQKTYGSTAFKLNDLDLQYLTTQGSPQWYYLEGTNTLAFYPIPQSQRIGIGFNGTDTVFRVAGGQAALDAGLSDFTVLVEAKVSSGAITKYLFDTYISAGGGGNGGIQLYVSGTLFEAFVANGSGTLQISMSADISSVVGDGEAHIFELNCVRAGNATLKVDGTVVATTSAAPIATLNLVTSEVAVSSTSGQFKGTMYQVAVGVGTSSLGSYEAGTNPVSYVPLTQSGLVALWKMQENYGAGGITDSVGGLFLTQTGTAAYQLKDPTPTMISFVSEYGEILSWDPGTDYLFESEYGVVLSMVDPSNVDRVLVDGLYGLVVGGDTGFYVGTISYVYEPEEITEDSDTPDLPGYMHWAMVYGVLEKAFSREGRTKNTRLATFYGARYKEMKTEWFARNKEWAKGQDQMISQQPVDWGSDMQWRDRVWP